MPASTCRPCIRPASPPKAESWTLDAFLKAAEACHKAGIPFGIGLGTTVRLVDTAGAFFQSFGAELVDAKGNITVKSDPVRQALDYCKQAGEVLSARCAGMGRRLQQQVAGLRQGRADHEPAERLGGRQARRAAGRRAVLDARLARPARRAASRRSCRTSGASGTSARTSRRPRACCRICRSRRRSRRWWRRAAATTCRPSRS